MARILGGNPNGEFRGKLGGLVFSRNKAGQYARSYAVPVDPKTVAQINARSMFSQSISGFHTLLPSEKSAWNTFASSYFTSKNRGNVPGLHSGVNAFVALHNTLLNVSRLQTTVSDLAISINANPVTVISQAPIVLTQNAPMYTMSGVFAHGDLAYSGILGIEMNTTTGIFTFEFGLVGVSPGPGVPGPTISDSIFSDGNGNQTGINIYASSMIIQDGVYVPSPSLVLIGSTGIIDSYTTTPVEVTSAKVEGSLVDLSSGYKSGFPIDSKVELSAYLFNSYGQQIKLGSMVIQIT